MKVDTGAKCNVISYDTLKRVKNREEIEQMLRITNMVAYGGNQINTVGSVVLSYHPLGQTYAL